MPKHARASSSSTHRYSALPVTLTPSSTQDMYNARMTMPAYYTDVQSAPMQPQPDQQYTTYMDSAPAPTAGNEVVTAAQQMSQARTASTAWSKEDDETLLRARAQGLNWSQIQQNYFRSKTSNACRKRHERLIEHRSADSWDKANFEKLSMEYMRLRKEIWSPLAAQVGEKWTVVEQKVSVLKKAMPTLLERGADKVFPTTVHVEWSQEYAERFSVWPSTTAARVRPAVTRVR